MTFLLFPTITTFTNFYGFYFHFHCFSTNFKDFTGTDFMAVNSEFDIFMTVNSKHYLYSQL